MSEVAPAPAVDPAIAPVPAPAPAPADLPAVTFDPSDSSTVKALKIFAEAMRQLAIAAWHGSKPAAITLAGIVTVGLIGGGGYVAWQHGIFDAPPPVQVQPVSVTLDGPNPEAVVGSTYAVIATISGPAGKPDWEITPATGATLTPAGEGGLAKFQAREAGHYTIRVTIPGEQMQLAKATIEVEALAISEPPPAPDPAPSDIGPTGPNTPPTPGPAGPVAPAHNPPAPTAPPTIGQLALEAINNVDSVDRASEAKVISGSIKLLKGKVIGGFVDPRANLIDELDAQCKEALSARYDAWGFTFFGTMKAGFEGLREHGILTAAQQLPALDEVDAALAAASH